MKSYVQVGYLPVNGAHHGMCRNTFLDPPALSFFNFFVTGIMRLVVVANDCCCALTLLTLAMADEKVRIPPRDKLPS